MSPMLIKMMDEGLFGGGVSFWAEAQSGLSFSICNGIRISLIMGSLFFFGYLVVEDS